MSNKTTGIDVDKWDYISRDCRYMGFKDGFDHERLMKFAKVCEADDGEKHICLREKVTIFLNL